MPVLRWGVAVAGDLDVDAVGALDRSLERRGVRDCQLHVGLEREPEIVQRPEIGRVGDSDLNHALAEKPHGERLSPAGESFREERRSVRIDFDPGQIDELQAVLLGERLRACLRIHGSGELRSLHRKAVSARARRRMRVSMEKTRSAGLFAKAAGLGFEPRLLGPEPSVLPLDDPATGLLGRRSLAAGWKKPARPRVRKTMGRTVDN